ncbi:hypothetical protein H5410_057685 [Solanum commersonii]|uniref:Uncharacterized protein n=1 Tax=Solanum commersonii TaxID=4109 RepID=A0A9J5WQQ9_SOLCO|nr:hypothetical protein H5410_057685 [Solanum commersonii]
MEAGLAVGGAFISSALNVLFDRLAPQGELLKMFQKHKNDVRLLKKLRMTLLGLQAVLSDAESKQASNQIVSQWLNEFRHAVDSAENLMEEVNYEALRLKVEGQHQNLAEISNQKENFGSTKQEARTPSTSLVDDSDIFGRHKEIEDLIVRLLSEDANGKNLAVVPIIGMGGMGKTTLAKAVYNDAKVKDHFGLKAWFCVSEAYDAFRITKGLLQEIGIKVDDNLNQLQVKLKESLKGKKFLVVLDDMWNDNYNEWDDLRNLFVQGDLGSKIIVTTRKENVASMMGSGAINVGTLSSEVSWALFKRHSLENRDPEEHPEFEEVGRKIADKCKGLPLALKALAGTLRCKSEVDEWRDILRSEIWELPSCLNGILPALMLSYNDLPAYLKQCFAYCAIYPKDSPFCKDQVIHLWIANGLVQQFRSGNQYFLELGSRSLFEMVPASSKRDVEKFLMHDLVNDLAQIASSKLCIRLEENKGSHMLEQSQHISYSKSEQLRTLIPVYFYSNQLSKRVMHNILHNLLTRLTSLRALSLSRYPFVELPDDLFIKLKLLRFLDLSSTMIKKLPDSICVLYNLETLLLSYCSSLEELPLQMEKLINLHHLDISNTYRLKMPLHLSKLKSLHVLVGATFLLGGPGGSSMEDLGELHNLYGSLSIELQNVVDRREALKAKMREKNHVDKLSLQWSESSTADNSQTERDILDELRPHTNIKEVEITRYRGTKFPNWLADHSFLKLVKLSLSYCQDCYSLPALGQLPCLKFLSISDMDGITEVTEEFYGSSSSKKPFNSLEKLKFKDMPVWKQWHKLGSGEFPKLEKLSIKNCPELMGKLPENLCSLKKLRISECPELNLDTSQLEGMKQIVGLDIVGCNSLTPLPFSILPSSLKRMRISCCEELKSEEPVGETSYCNMFLEDLTLEECDCIDDISPELLPRARELTVYCCPNLTRFMIPTAPEGINFLSCLNLEKLSVPCGGTQITSLHIWDCSKLKWLPERMQELLPSLKKLQLEYCPAIESFPDGGLPFNLQQLRIIHCTKLVNGRKEWLLPRLIMLVFQNDGNYQEIKHDGSDEEIEHDGSDEEMEHDGSGEFPKLEKLSIKNCPELMGKLPENLCSLKKLRISECPELNLDTSQLEGMKQIVELDIVGCNSLTPLPFSILPSTLKRMRISCFEDLKSEEPVGEMSYCNMFLEDLTLEECDCTDDISPELLPRARELTVSCCPNLTRFTIPTAPEGISFLSCLNLEKLSVPCGGTQITYLYIWDCTKLKCLPERMQKLLPSLKKLELWYCSEIESFPEGGLPFSLQQLVIINCTKLVNGQKEWLLPRLIMLQIHNDENDKEMEHDGSDEEMENDGSDGELEHDGSDEEIEHVASDEEMEHDASDEEMEHDGSDEDIEHDGRDEEIEHDSSDEEIEHDASDEEIEHWELPSSITTLGIRNLKTLSSQDLKSLTSLEYLYAANLPQIQSMLEEGRLPSSLSKLHLSYHDKLHSLHLWHLTSLQSLHISGCRNLQSLSESALPSSLSELAIYDCPKLQFFPVKGMPSSLSKLTVFRCPLLTPLLEFGKGKYWLNIAQIPIIHIDHIYM